MLSSRRVSNERHTARVRRILSEAGGCQTQEKMRLMGAKQRRTCTSMGAACSYFNGRERKRAPERHRTHCMLGESNEIRTMRGARAISPRTGVQVRAWRRVPSPRLIENNDHRRWRVRANRGGGCFVLRRVSVKICIYIVWSKPN